MQLIRHPILLLLVHTASPLSFSPNELNNSPKVSSNISSWVKRFREPLGKNGNPQIILMFGDNGYRDIVTNAMAQFYKLGVHNYVVVCTDRELALFLQGVGRPCYYDPTDTGYLASLWQRRLQILTAALAGGTDVLLTDADAVWKKNPLHLLTDADITASRGSYPPKVANMLGATACMGFVYFTGNPAVTDFVKNEVMSTFSDDDQAALNNAFIENDISFGSQLPLVSSNIIDTGVIPAKGSRRQLVVNLLDQRRFQRDCSNSSHDAYVVHCLSHKEGDAKKQSLKDNALYYIKDDLESTAMTGNFESWIRSVMTD